MVRLLTYVMMGMVSFLGLMLSDGYAQEKSKEDSLRTLNFLQEALNEVLEEKKQKEQDILKFEIDGLIVDQTITKIGRDFYDIFYSQWVAPPKARNFTIVIKELPIPGMGTQVMILVNEAEIFKQRVQPRYDFIEAVAEYAIRLTTNYLQDFENMKSQLEGDDQKGTGIF